MNKAGLALGLASSALLLAGCQQFGSMFAAKPASADNAQIDLSGYFAERLEAGRRHLLQHRPGQAITAFRQASYDRATAASAYNGMAIAYTEMGRDDLARRYFMAALQADPTDERVVRNLARLDSLPPAATPETPARAEAAAPMAPPAPIVTAGAAAGEATSPALVRVSNREVTLSPFGTGNARRPVEVRVSARPARSASLSGRVVIERPVAARSPSQAYPLRLALADVPAAPRENSAVRTELPQPK